MSEKFLKFTLLVYWETVTSPVFQSNLLSVSPKCQYACLNEPWEHFSVLSSVWHLLSLHAQQETNPQTLLDLCHTNRSIISYQFSVQISGELFMWVPHIKAYFSSVIFFFNVIWIGSQVWTTDFYNSVNSITPEYLHCFIT